MGHADIQTTMIYAHHVPRHDPAGRLTALLEERARRTVDAWEQSAAGGGFEKPLDSGETSAGGRTRTCDTRIMIPLL
jgi:hypothetical protein